jgi:hypothetical protein
VTHTVEYLPNNGEALNSKLQYHQRKKERKERKTIFFPLSNSYLLWKAELESSLDWNCSIPVFQPLINTKECGIE